MTHALLPGSVAVDRGDNSLVSFSTDQRGADRILDGNADGIATVDIGAVEFSIEESPLPYLQFEVSSLGDIGTLNVGQETSLVAFLTQAQRLLEYENPSASVLFLNLFIDNVARYVESGDLTQEEGNNLTDLAQTVIDELEGEVAVAPLDELDALFADDSLDALLNG